MTDQHTPTPWRLDPDGHIASGELLIANVWTRESNAEFIVRAVNEYEKLKQQNEAMREALEYTVATLATPSSHAHRGKDGRQSHTKATVLARARAALKLANHST